MGITVITGSARSQGYTEKAVLSLSRFLSFDTVHLRDYNIGHYDYEHNYSDDFLPLITRLINDYDLFIIATPVYWYTMSGIMKVFFDRITDLLDAHKELGRKLRGKKMAVITSSVGDHFWHPFVATARYLGINYLTDLHTIENQYNIEIIKQFAARLYINQ